MTTSNAFRSELVKALHADLIGPFLPEGHPGAGEAVLPLPPSRWYMAGFLALQAGRVPYQVDMADQMILRHYRGSVQISDDNRDFMEVMIAAANADGDVDE